jgi:hypothetical protein
MNWNSEPGLFSEFQACLGYIERPYLKNQNDGRDRRREGRREGGRFHNQNLN